MRKKSNSHSFSAIEQAQSELRDAIAHSKALTERTDALLSRCRGTDATAGSNSPDTGSQLQV